MQFDLFGETRVRVRKCVCGTAIEIVVTEKGLTYHQPKGVVDPRCRRCWRWLPAQFEERR